MPGNVPFVHAGEQKGNKRAKKIERERAVNIPGGGGGSRWKLRTRTVRADFQKLSAVGNRLGETLRRSAGWRLDPVSHTASDGRCAAWGRPGRGREFLTSCWSGSTNSRKRSWNWWLSRVIIGTKVTNAALDIKTPS